MRILVECVEPEALPLKLSIDVVQLERFRLFVLNDVRFGQSSSLRSTILMKADEDPPPEASLAMELDVYDPGAGDPLVFRTKRMGSRVFTDLVRPNVRSRLSEGHEIPSGSRLEMILQDTRRLAVTLQMESDLMRRADAIGGGGIRHKPATDMSAGWFLYNSVAQLMTMNGTIIKDKIILYMRKWGIHPAILLTLGSIGLVFVMGGAIAYNRHQAAEDAEGRAEALEKAQERAEAARSNALSNEMACLQQQQMMASKLKEIEVVKQMLATQALKFSFTQGVAVENGGSRMLAETSKPFDEQYQTTTLKDVVFRMEAVVADPGSMEFCLEQEQVLGLDLPHYVLTWHPDSKLVCPLQYSVVEAGINRMGAWGLSERVAREFGAQNLAEGGQAGQEQLTEQLGDPRMAPRWAASTLAIGLREVQFTLLTSDTGPRPPVASSQAHLWTLALWDAYNRMPSPADGVMDKPVGYCVEELMTSIVSRDEAPVPGMPVLPDITLVAAGEKSIIVPPTPGCPWPDGVFQLGAKASLRAAANMSVYLEVATDEEDDEG
jgi:hypothetical protein